LVPETETKPPLPPSSRPPKPSLAKRVTNATTRFISSFRGRTIHGLKVQVPPGYVGVVIKADGQLEEVGKGNLVNRNGKGKEIIDRMKGRSTRSKTRVVIDVDVEGEENLDDGMDVDEPSIDPASIRTLVPSSRFSSFILWHPDNPVDEGRDEYYRSLTEWLRLAHEVGLFFFPTIHHHPDRGFSI
jgi:ribonuclease H2 subunit C